MSNEDQIKEIADSLKSLADINEQVMSSISALSPQNAALSHAIMIISASVKSHGIDIREDLIELSIRGLREKFNLNPPRDKLIRDLLFGDPSAAPVVTNFTVIQGGKDGSQSDPA